MHRGLALAILLSAGSLEAQKVDTAALQRDLPRMMQLGDVPGLSIALVQKGKVSWTGAFGTLDDSARTPVDTNTVFEAASLSKPVFAYTVMRLVDRGEFNLDRPLAEILEYPRLAHDERYRRITARMILSHTSGLPNWGGERLDLRFDPGTGWQYSGEGYVYLQLAVEKATGKSLQELAQREVFAPLGMAHSSYVWQNRFAGNAAYARDYLGQVGPIDQYSAPNAAFSLLTTAGDYARFLAAMLDGAGLSAHTWQMMLTPVRSVHQPWNPQPTDPYLSWGLGWGLQDGRAGRSILHGGNNNRRFRAYVIGYPGRKTGVVFFTNSGDGMTIGPEIVSRVVRDDDWDMRTETPHRYDDPRQLAIKAVQRAALDGAPDSAIARFRAAHADAATRLDIGDVTDLADFVAAHGEGAAARELIRSLVVDYPDSVRAHDLYGRILLQTGDFGGAITEYRRSLALHGDSTVALRRIAWIQDRLAARDRLVSVPLPTLASYAGTYGPRRITLRDGRLYYRRGSNPEYAMFPMAEDLFALEGQENFRIRFERSDPGPATRLIGMDMDGQLTPMDRSP